MRKKLFFRFLYTLWCLPVLSATINVKPTLTIEEAVEQCLKHKPSLQAFKYLIEAQRINEKASWTDYYPHINVGINTRIAQTNQSVHCNAATMSLGIQQLIYDFAGPQEKAKLAHIKTQQAQLQELIAQNDTQIAIEETFFESWRLQNQQRALQKLADSAKAKLHQDSSEYVAALRNKNNILTSMSEYATQNAQVMIFPEQLKIMETQLSFLIGYSIPLTLQESDNSTTLVWNQPNNIHLEPLMLYVKQAHSYRPEIQLQKKTVDLYEQQAYIAARSRLPRFFMGALVSRTDEERTRGHWHNHNDHQVNANVQWPLTDGFASDYEREKAHTLKMEAILQQKEIENRIRSEVETAYHSLKKALINLQTEHASYRQVHNEYDLRSLEFNQGLITAATYKQALTNWEQAQYAWLSKKTDVAINLRKLSYRCGYPEKNMIK